MSTNFDPYAPVVVSRWRYLHALNPLVKIAAFLPAMLVLVFVRDYTTPLIFMVIAYVLILTGTRLTYGVAAVIFLIIPIAVLLISVGFSLWVRDELVAGTAVLFSIGDWNLYSGAVEIGLATALRLGSIISLALVGGLSSTGPDLVRASIQQLRLPYRIGYTALAAYRFVPRFKYELQVIRAAHRVRGHHGGRGPIARVARGWGYIVPLLAGAIRHAERVALAMDARAFGAFATRTERYLVPFRVRDWVFLFGMLAASALIFCLTYPWEL